MTINQNLRQLRRISGMTQEEVARQVGLTRQAISGYESGRTQPDLDMLVRLAELYRADISDILYGGSRTQRQLRTVRRIGIAGSVAPLALMFAGAGLLFFINTCFPVPAGSSFAGSLMEVRFSILKIRDILCGAAGLISGAACLVLAVLLTNGKQLPTIRTCTLLLCALTAGALACTLPFALFDKIYTPADYLLLTTPILLPPYILYLYRTALGAIKKSKKTNQADKK